MLLEKSLVKVELHRIIGRIIMVCFILPEPLCSAQNSCSPSPCRGISIWGLDIAILDTNHSLVVRRKIKDHFNLSRNHTFNASYFKISINGYIVTILGNLNSRVFFVAKDLYVSSGVFLPSRPSVFLLSLIFYFSLSISLLPPSVFRLR